MHLAIRVFGTLGVIVLLTYPLWAPEWGQGILGEIFLVPFPGNLAIVVGFFLLVALYCATLQQTLRLAGAPSHSVWWMFAIPANFVEDFYIVRRVGDAARPRVSRSRLTVWLSFGFGWCVLQILSLLPGEIGMITGALALVVWMTHWMLTFTLNRRMR